MRGVLAGFSLGAWLLLRTPAGKAADAKEETNCVELGLRVHEAAIRLCVRRARWLPRANRSGENSPNLIDLERQNLDVLVSAMASGTLLASVRIAVQFIAKLRFRFWFSGLLSYQIDRLTQPHPLNAFELAQGAIKVPLEACFVAGQAVEILVG